MQYKPDKFVAITFMFVAVFGFGVIAGATVSANSAVAIFTSGEIKYDQTYIAKIINEIERNYLGDLPDTVTTTQGIAKGLVESLDNQYTAYLSPEEAKEYLDSADSVYEGIGVYLGYDGQYTVVTTPIDGFPAQVAGIISGDVILEVDGEDVAGKRPAFTSKLILGNAGTDVDLKVYREKTQELLEFKITRQRIELENISFEMINGVALIDIVRFTEGDEGSLSGVQVFNQKWDNIVTQVVQQNPKGLIIDLRNNPGGFVHGVRYVVEEFLKEGDMIMQEDEKGSEVKYFYDDRLGKFEDIPIVVLVNSGSASASEIFAGAIQDNNRGKVIGEPTYGKGVEQILVDLDDGSLLMLTYRRWLTPQGRNIDQDSPITPDIEVEFDVSESNPDLDTQTLEALKQLGAVN